MPPVADLGCHTKGRYDGQRSSAEGERIEAPRPEGCGVPRGFPALLWGRDLGKFFDF